MAIRDAAWESKHSKFIEKRLKQLGTGFLSVLSQIVFMLYQDMRVQELRIRERHLNLH